MEMNNNVSQDQTFLTYGSLHIHGSLEELVELLIERQIPYSEILKCKTEVITNTQQRRVNVFIPGMLYKFYSSFLSFISSRKKTKYFIRTFIFKTCFISS
jgi:hypothetical protein